MNDDLHHRFRGDDLQRYRAALYAQWRAERHGITIADERLHPDRITVEWDDDDRAKAVIFYAVGIDVRVRLP
jgi:hypothetical protein